MIFNELSDDDKKFIDEQVHKLDALSMVVLGLAAKANNISLREAEASVASWYDEKVAPIIDEHYKKHSHSLIPLDTPNTKVSYEKSNVPH